MVKCNICNRDIDILENKVGLVSMNGDTNIFLEIYHKQCWENKRYGNKGNPKQNKYYKNKQYKSDLNDRRK